MKGGSMTKILIETLFLSCFKEILPNQITNLSTPQILQTFETAMRNVYLEIEEIAPIAALAANALSKSQHVYYVGVSSAGVLGIIDASE